MAGLIHPVLAQQMTRDTPIPPALELPHPQLSPPNLSTDQLWPWWYWLVGAALILTVLWIISELSKGFKSHRSLHIPPLKKAEKRFEKLRKDLDQIHMENLSHFVSQIIRLYQHEKYLQPFQCQTMEEIYEHGILSQSEAIKSIFYPIAKKLESISFSPHRETLVQKQQLLDDAWQALLQDDRLPASSEFDQNSVSHSSESASAS